MKDQHEHTWIRATKTVALRNYVTENGKIVKDLIKGKDILKLWYCTVCKATLAYDLDRRST